MVQCPGFGAVSRDDWWTFRERLAVEREREREREREKGGILEGEIEGRKGEG